MPDKLHTTSHAHETNGPLPAAIFTVFGATGDLSLRYIMPTLLHMESENLFPEGFAIIAAGRREISTAQFFELLDTAGYLPKVGGPALERFKKRVEYVAASFEIPESFEKLKEKIGDRSGSGNSADSGHECFNRFYYFAVAPKYFAVGAKLLKEYGLLDPCTEHGKTVRLMIEKPFGNNQQSAAELSSALLNYFSENQIYRTDHYLGKETVQNMLVLRFANEFLEPIWNHEYVDHVEISMLESDGVGHRGATYDMVGALSDVVQNHLLQLLAFTAMERPKKNEAESLRDEKNAVLQALRGFSTGDISDNVVRGQYAEYVEDLGMKDNKKNVSKDKDFEKSFTETFVAIKTFIDNPRWKGVPFYLRAGKKMPRRIAEISVHFKPNKSRLFENEKVNPNILSVQLQPKEKITMRINNKIPGTMELHSGELVFNYEDQFHSDTPPAYERLFLDFFQGDQRLFIRNDEVQASWKFIDSIRDNWNEQNSPLREYVGGADQPEESKKLIESDGRKWFTK
jgi:glucose-6-phosphate 1-dehydrogenase